MDEEYIKLIKKVHKAIDHAEAKALETVEEEAYNAVILEPNVCRWAIEGYIDANPSLGFFNLDSGDMSEPWTMMAGAYLTACVIEHISCGNYEPQY